jgi:glycosyltransferase involved in cell wall biosynthesis
LIAALNTGLDICRGRWVVRMDADDISHPLRLQSLLSHAALNYDVSVWGSRVRLFPRKNLKDGMIQYERWLNSLCSHDDIKKNLFVECPLAHPAMMVKRDVLAGVGGYQDNGWPEDYDLIFRLFLKGYRMGIIPQHLMFWRYHPQKMILKNSRYSAENFFDVKYHYFNKFFSSLRQKRNFVIMGGGDNAKSWLRALLNDGFFVSMILDLYPGRVGQKIAGVPVEHPDNFNGEGFFVCTAGVRGAREEMREWLVKRGFIEWEDFVCVA